MSTNPLLLRILFLVCVVLFGADCTAGDLNVDVRSASTPGGISYWYVNEQSLPIVSISIAFKKAGSSYDPEGQRGLAHLVSLVMPHAEIEGEESVLRKFSEKGIDLSASVDHENMYISLKTLSDNLELALNMLGKCLLDAHISDEVFSQEKERQKSEVRHSMTHPGELALYGMGRMLFGEHPHGSLPMGNIEDIDSITLDDVSRYKRDSFDLNQMIVGVVGDVNEDTLQGMLDASFAGLNRGQNLKTVAHVDADIGGRGYIKYDSPQSVVMFVGRGVAFDDPKYHAMKLLVHALGGTSLSSVLMKELREKLGITYHVSSSLYNDGDINALVGVLYTDNSTAKRGVDGIFDVIKEVKKHGLDEQSFSISKADILDSFVFTFLNTSSLAHLLMQLQLQGRGPNYIAEYRALFDSITLQDVNKVAREMLGSLSVIEVGMRNSIGGKAIL
ncbi:M16 family metallopeptidase [Anaplasma capra]|uniref:M16 family metallopeptidase n=1 Tax=Anaplasma capra TaxID=1562740 RepID=UPI0021D6033E|nr:pitrilysin family protein [Anaplasma capra]MCU7611288.1 insulinase family protein [Anaplasma capra]MCU7612717.1 insulinase family protein [Anaplasma capra]